MKNKNTETEYDEAKWELDNLRTYKFYDPIRFGEINFRNRYYDHYFHSNDEEYINQACEVYLYGVFWVTTYYFDKCQDWRWFYPYNEAPLISDLYKYLLMNSIDYTINVNKSIRPLTQLAILVPPKYRRKILPKTYYEQLSSPYCPISDLYPIQVNLDIINKTLLWTCNPVLPPLDAERAITYIESIKLSASDIKRNKMI